MEDYPDSWTEPPNDGGREVIHRQGKAAGIARSTLYEQAERRGWDLVQPRVLAMAGMPWNWEREAAAAALSLSPRVLVSRRAAAHLWGLLDREPRPIELVVPTDRRVITPAGAMVWRSGSLLRADKAFLNGVPATTTPRTLCDLAAVVSDLDELIEIIAIAVQRRLVTLEQIRTRADGMSVTGAFSGSSQLRKALDALEGRRTDSTAERVLLGSLTVGGIPPDETLYPLRDEAGQLVAVLDMAYMVVTSSVWRIHPDSWTNPPDLGETGQRAGVRPLRRLRRRGRGGRRGGGDSRGSGRGWGRCCRWGG